MQRPASRPPSTPPVAVRVYRLGLRLYPASYRRRFGPEMDQVFRDQWRVARASASIGALLGLLLRTGADLLLTALRERLVSLRESMNLPRPSSPLARLGWSLGAGLPVAVAMVGLAVAITLALPRIYQSEAKVLVRHPVASAEPNSPAADPFIIAQATEMMTSTEVLTRVVDKLSLNERWSRGYLADGTLSTPETVDLLRTRILVRSIRNTPVLSVRVHDTDRALAAEIANAVTETYLSLRPPSPTTNTPLVERGVVPNAVATIVDLAEPGLKPIRPNLPLNVFLGLVSGGLLGLFTSAAVWLWLGSRSRPMPPTRTA